MRTLINILITCFLVNTVRSQNESVYFTKLNSGILSDTVKVVAVDKKGNKWVGTPKGLVMFDGKNWKKFDSTNSTFMFPNPVLDIKVQNNGNVLVGCWGNTDGLNIYDGKKWKTINGGRGFMVIKSIAVDLNDDVWIGSDGWDGGTGLGKITNDKIEVYTKWEKQIPANDITAIAVDKTNSIWIATNMNGGLGLTKFNNIKSVTYTTDNSKISSNNVTVIKPRNNGSIWIGTKSNGISVLKDKKWTNYSTKNSKIVNDSITAILEDSLGNIWLGTNGGGLHKFKDGLWTIYNTSNSTLPNTIYALCLDKFGDLWIGSNKGLLLFKLNK